MLERTKDKIERSLVIIKPDAMQRRLVGEILARFERRGFIIQGLKLTRLARELVEEHYAVHKGKPFYEPLVRFMTSGPVVVAAIAGKGAVAGVRAMLGVTACIDSVPGSIRGDMGISNRFNLVHASDSPETADHEIRLFFDPDELVDWTPDDYTWVLDFSEGEPI